MKPHIKEQLEGVPLTPGVYFVRNQQSEPIYIGKARQLRKRLTSHFRKTSDYKEKLIQRDGESVDYIETATEAEALLLESSLIKQHYPKYNRELKDDKSYPFLKITMSETYPRLLISRGRRSDGSVYFGPYTSVRLLRQAVALLRRLFPMRTCQPLTKRVCLMYHIGQCGGPCESKIDEKAYREIAKELILFLNGKRAALTRSLGKRMQEASRAKRYEEAKLYRDHMQALSAVSGSQQSFNRIAVLNEMKRTFNLDNYPRVIETFDISNFSGKNPVGSMVRFEDGQPRKQEYRRFKIKSVQGIDDYQMMREVVSRRYQRLLNEKKPLPDLVLIDGGKGHLAAAQGVLLELNLHDLDLLSIAKQHEHIFKSGRGLPFILPLDSPLLHLLRQMRDEAHRFAITFYRRLHKRELGWSVLDGIPGVGAKRKLALMRAFKSVDHMRKLNAQALQRAKGVDLKTANSIEEYFKRS